MSHPPLAPMVPLADGRAIPQVGYGMYKVPAAEATRLAITALELGYRHLDTAALYGNEAEAGAAVRECGLPREDVFVTSKVWNDDHGYDATLRAFDRSMINLGLEYVDMYLIHWPCPRPGLFQETYRALETLYREGKVRAIGVSNFQAQHLDRLLETAEVVPAVNQIELHPWLQQTELREKHRQLGIVTEAWSPLGRGQVLEDPDILALAAEHKVTAAQVILRWHLQLGHVAIPKASSWDRIRQNLDIFGFELSALDMADVAGLDRGHRTGSHPDNVN